MPENAWLSLVGQIMNAHNYALLLSKNDDEKYVQCLLLMANMLKPLYVSKNAFNEQVFFRAFQLFIYLYEFEYNVLNNENGLSERYISISDCFNRIKKNWNVDIEKKIKKYSKLNDEYGFE